MADPNYTVIRGNIRYNATVFQHTETRYRYIRTMSLGGKIYLRCALKDACRATAVIKEADQLIPLKPHFHGVDLYPRNTDIKNLLKKTVAEGMGQHSKRQIFDRVTREHSRGSEVSFPEIERSLHRAQRRGQPKVPSSAAEACQLLQEEGIAMEYGRNMQMMLDDDTGEIALVFYSPDMERFLAGAESINFDGTFFVVPSQFYQLFSIHFLYKDHTFPLFYVLMTSKSASLYLKVFQFIKNRFPDFSPMSSMSDFEVASSDAFQTVYPDAELFHCHFHYSQCIWRKVQKVGLTLLYKRDALFKSFVQKIMSLPYLPPSLISPTADIILQGYHSSAANSTQVGELKRYITRFWLGKIGAEKLSVHSIENATNNTVESFHSRLKTRIQTHKPNFWSFLQHINHLIVDTLLEIERLDAGHQITRRAATRYIRNKERREKCKRKLAEGLFSPVQFINAISHTFRPDNSHSHAGNLDRLHMETEGEEPEAPEADGENGRGERAENYDRTENATSRCVVCLGPRHQVKIFLPCGHGGCGSCADEIVSRELPCPVCRGNVTGAVQAFL